MSSVVYSSFYAENDTPCSDLTGATSVACSFCGTVGTPGSCSSTPGRYCCLFAGYTQYTRAQNTTVTTYTRSSATNETTTTYTSAARIISSVSGTVSTNLTTTLATSTSSYPNIASMQVGRRIVRGDAVMVLSLDDPIPPRLLVSVHAINGIQEAHPVTL